MGGIDTVHQGDFIAFYDVLGVGVAQLNGELLHLQARADVLHGVHHVNFQVLGELVNHQVPVVPHFQGVVSVNLALADSGVQVPDAGQELVDILHILPQMLFFVVFQLLQLIGIFMKIVGNFLGRFLDQRIVYLLSGLHVQTAQGLDKGVESAGEDAVTILSIGHLVQDRGQIIVGAQNRVGIAHLGAF